MKGKGGMALWLTGLPGSGKSTIADRIKKIYPGFVILRMDEFRKIVTPKPTYSDFERDIVYRSLVYLARLMTGHEHNVIIDATGNLRKWRNLARKLIPRYAEIYLRCSLEAAMEREKKRIITHKAPKGIYEKGRAGWPVPGLRAPYEASRRPELVIETDVMSVEESMRPVKKLIGKLRN